MSASEKTPIAVITAAAGIKGDVWVKSLIQPAERIFDLLPLHDETRQNEFILELRYAKPLRKKAVSPQSHLLRCGVSDVTDRNQAESLIGITLYADFDGVAADNQTPKVIGMTVCYRESAQYSLGTVKDVSNFGASDLLVIVNAHGQEFLVPWIDDYVAQIIDDKNMIILHQDAFGFFE